MCVCVCVRACVRACVGARARVCGPLDLLFVSVAVSAVAAPGPARSARPSAISRTPARDPPSQGASVVALQTARLGVHARVSHAVRRAGTHGILVSGIRVSGIESTVS